MLFRIQIQKRNSNIGDRRIYDVQLVLLMKFSMLCSALKKSQSLL